MTHDIKKLAIRQYVIRALVGKELYGYEITKELARMGVSTKHNYVYMILSEMEKEGLLKAKWADNPGGGPSRHFYSLSDEGKEELKAMLWDAIDLLSVVFLSEIAASRPISSLDDLLTPLGIPKLSGNVVVALPDSNPAVALQLLISNLTVGVPQATVYVVKPKEMTFHEPPKGVTVLDGRRHDLPFKDEFADFLIVFGLPSQSSEEESIKEFGRVLSKDGYLIVKHPNSLSTDRMPQRMTGYEYFGKILYEIYDKDKIVSIHSISELLRKQFGTVKDVILGGSTYIWAHSKRQPKQSISYRHDSSKWLS